MEQTINNKTGEPEVVENADDNEMVPLHYRERKKQPYVDSRELYTFLQIREPHSDWIKDQIEHIPLVENKDFAIIQTN